MSAPNETCIARPDDDLTLDECIAMTLDYRCRDGIVTEFLDRDQRDYAAFIWHLIQMGRFSED